MKATMSAAAYYKKRCRTCHLREGGVCNWLNRYIDNEVIRRCSQLRTRRWLVRVSA